MMGTLTTNTCNLKKKKRLLGLKVRNVKRLFLLNQLHKCHANVSLLAVVQRQSDFLKVQMPFCDVTKKAIVG